VGLEPEQPLIETVAGERARAASQQGLGRFLRLLPLQKTDVLRLYQDLDLVGLPQRRESLDVAFLDSGQEGGAEAAHFSAVFERFLDERRRPQWADGLVQTADDRPDIDPGGGRLDQHPGV